VAHCNSIDVFSGERGCASAPRTPGANATGLALLLSCNELLAFFPQKRGLSPFSDSYLRKPGVA
jgi:hypothetical protein